MDTLGFNELYSASSVDPNNPYADQASYGRFIANVLPLALTGGRGILANVTSKLSPRLQAFAGQMFPFLTKRGTFFRQKQKELDLLVTLILLILVIQHQALQETLH